MFRREPVQLIHVVGSTTVSCKLPVANVTLVIFFFIVNFSYVPHRCPLVLKLLPASQTYRLSRPVLDRVY